MANAQEILALESRRFAAMMDGDMDALAALVHDELVYTHSSGVVDGKASWLESMRSGKTRYRKVTRTEEKARVYGDTALVTARARLEVELGGQPKTLQLRYLSAWTKTPAGWKFVAWQSGALPA